ncbi:MAG: hypothetical protein KDD45_00405 [Bdellovibrionales bacterium]|nr:hypothetical protein [Bdellovibrionales bacterium]
MVEEITKGEENMVATAVEGGSCCQFILGFIILVSEILDEGSELLFDFVPQVLLGQFVHSLYLHGA